MYEWYFIKLCKKSEFLVWKHFICMGEIPGLEEKVGESEQGKQLHKFIRCSRFRKWFFKKKLRRKCPYLTPHIPPSLNFTELF